MSRAVISLTLVASVAVSAVITGCSPASSGCGAGTESPEAGVSAFLSAVVEEDADLACTVLPSGTTPEPAQQEIDHYRSLGITSEDINTFTGEQMGSGYDVAEPAPIQLLSETRGRWIWAKGYWTITPVTYSIPDDTPPDSTPTTETSIPAAP
jgi:hypothetical protein